MYWSAVTAEHSHSLHTILWGILWLFVSTFQEKFHFCYGNATAFSNTTAIH